MTGFTITNSEFFYRNDSGVSLIEIMVVSVIVSILALLAMPAPGFSKKKDQELLIKETVSVVREALYRYRLDHFGEIELPDGTPAEAPMFPCYSSVKDYGNESGALDDSKGYAVNAVVTVADLLEASLLKSTCGDLDKRNMIVDFETGFSYYKTPHNASPCDITEILNSTEVLMTEDMLPLYFDDFTQKQYAGNYLVCFTVPFYQYTAYRAVFQWFVRSTNYNGEFRLELNDTNTLLSYNGAEFSPKNCGSILKTPNYKGLYNTSRPPPTPPDLPQPPYPDYAYLEVFQMPLLSPYLRGDNRTRRWDSVNVLTYQRSQGIPDDEIDLPGGFPRNPIIPRSIYLEIDHLDPFRIPERTYWEAHVRSLISPFGELWVPFNATLAEINGRFSTDRFVIDDVRFPDMQNLSNYYTNAAHFLTFFPLLDKDGNPGSISQEDRDAYLNITGEKYFWNF